MPILDLQIFDVSVAHCVAKQVNFCSVIICFTVIESHPDNALEDLRLDKPFPELREHFQSYDLDRMEKKVGSLHTFLSL